ncbi:Muskelin N-terminus-domain-containing protein [Mycena sp. CBHHK59/15]|nr:Muskelin N-terminus-domain-containing protein [Mycena sp. CBHHK59/15]
MAAASVLTYSIASCPAHSGPYSPENILIDNPSDQTSRWSGPTHDSPQWLLLRLDTLAVVQSIVFGKVSHPCNMKDFKVYVGPREDTLTEALRTSLKNDTQPESFDLKHVNDLGILTPSRYVKIVPINSHGDSFHTSIWHVSLKGVKDEVFVEQVRLKYEQVRRSSSSRTRQNNGYAICLETSSPKAFSHPYNVILTRCGLQVEDPLVTELHESVVLQGNWSKAEETIQRMSQTDLFDEYRNSGQCHSVWRRLHGKDPNGDVPSRRGGHAMCIDHIGGTIYLFGGWNGQSSLDDFWAYDIKQEKWRVLSYHTSTDKDAPAARSCHKMVFDTKTGNIYVLGRLSDADAARLDMAKSAGETVVPGPKVGCEFYRYHTRGSEAGQWEFLSRDPQMSHDPPLIYDHQMVIDCEAQILYVYGGRVIDGDVAYPKYAGLYSYNVRLSKWLNLLTSPTPRSSFSGGIIPARFGHSMVLDDRSRTLFIFGGKVEQDNLYDMYSYDIATKKTKQLFSDFAAVDGGLEGSFTLRAVIDPKLQEIYIFCGLAKEGSNSMIPYNSSNRIFRYDPPPGNWDLILPAPFDDAASAPPRDEPLPRFAHQVVYDPTTLTIFMHGGNGGIRDPRGTGDDENAMMDEGEEKETRLDDFWQMTLSRFSTEDVVRRATYQIRTQQFREMCEDVSPTKALNFLQTAVSNVVDHDDPEETESFRGLLSYLLAPSAAPLSSHPHLKTPSSGSDHEDSPPRKRSRPNTPEDSEMTSPPALIAPAAKIAPFDAQFVRETEDPEELKADGSSAVSATRFQQRNSLFESLLEFVSKEAKQPSGSLLGALDGFLALPQM